MNVRSLAFLLLWAACSLASQCTLTNQPSPSVYNKDAYLKNSCVNGEQCKLGTETCCSYVATNLLVQSPTSQRLVSFSSARKTYMEYLDTQANPSPLNTHLDFQVKFDYLDNGNLLYPTSASSQDGVAYMFDNLSNYLGMFSGLTNFGNTFLIRKGPDSRIYAISYDVNDLGDYSYAPVFLDVFDSNGNRLRSRVDLHQRNTSTILDISLKSGSSPSSFCDVFILAIMQILASETNNTNFISNPLDYPYSYQLIQVYNLSTITPTVSATNLESVKLFSDPTNPGASVTIRGFDFLPNLAGLLKDCFVFVYEFAVQNPLQSALSTFCFQSVTPFQVAMNASSISVITLIWPDVNDLGDVFYKNTVPLMDVRQIRLRKDTNLTYINDYTGFYLPWIYDAYNNAFIGNLGKSGGLFSGGTSFAFDPTLFAPLSHVVNVTTGNSISNQVAGTNVSFMLKGSDRSGNVMIVNPTDVIVEVMTSTLVNGVCLDVSFVAPITYVSSSYSLLSFVPSIAGLYSVSVKLNSSVIDDDIAGSPFAFNVLPSILSPIDSIAKGLGTTQSTAGKWSYFIITAKDVYGNNQNVSCQVTLEFDALGDQPSYKVFNNLDGTYRVAYLTTYSSPERSMSVFINNQSILGSPFAINVSPSTLVPSNCVVTFGTFTQTALPHFDVSIVYTMEIIPRDVYGNDIYVGGDELNFYINASYVGTTTFIELNITRGANGLTLVSFIPKMTTNISLSITHAKTNLPISNMPMLVLSNVVQTPFQESNAIKYMIILFALLGIIISVVFLQGVRKFNYTTLFKMSQYRICYLVLIGSIISYISAIIFCLPESVITCNVGPFCHYFSLVLIYGCLSQKTWRIVKIHNNSGLQKIRITESALYIRIFAMALGIVVILSFGFIFALWEKMTMIGIQSTTADGFTIQTMYTVCSNSGNIYGVVSGYFTFFYIGSILSYGVYYAYISRKISDVFAESRGTAIGIYNTTLLGGLSTLIIFSMGDSISPDLKIILKGSFILISSQVAILALFVPKFKIILSKKDVDISGTEVDSTSKPSPADRKGKSASPGLAKKELSSARPKKLSLEPKSHTQVTMKTINNESPRDVTRTFVMNPISDTDQQKDNNKRILSDLNELPENREGSSKSMDVRGASQKLEEVEKKDSKSVYLS